MNQIIFEEEVTWLESLKERYIPQAKQKWNEEDEKIVLEVISNYDSGYFPSVSERERIIKGLSKLIKDEN